MSPVRLSLICAFAAVLLSGCSYFNMNNGKETAAAEAAPPVSEPKHKVRGTETAVGTFIGASNHATSGHVSIFRSGKTWVVSFADDFSFDGAPDPKVGFGNKGKFDAKSTLAPLKNNSGAQIYVVPGDVDVGDYLQVFLWCEKFSVPLGIADLRLN